MRSTATLALVLCLTWAWGQSRQAAEQYVNGLVAGNSTLFGFTDGELAVSSTGALQYSIPIACVPGRSGMTPELSFTYDSNAGSGLMGKGWSVSGFSTITRTARNLAMDGEAGRIAFDTGDRLALDGQRLVPIDSTQSYWPNGAQLRTSFLTEQNTFRRVDAFFLGGEVQRFEVRTKEGLIYYYGARGVDGPAQYLRDRRGPTSNIISWPLVRIMDLNGNTIDYNYEDRALDDHFLKPLSILYTGYKDEKSYFASITFGYWEKGMSVRPGMSSVKYINGTAIKFQQYLQSIDCQYTGSTTALEKGLLRSYKIEYEADPALPTCVTVKRISECAGGDSLHTDLTWLYASATAQFPEEADASDAGISISEEHALHLGDFNGDGLLDQVAVGLDKDTVRLYFRPNTGGRWGSTHTQALGGAIPKDARIVVGDADANGTADIRFCWISGNRWNTRTVFTARELQARTIGTSWMGKPASTRLADNVEIEKISFVTNDLDRDGRSDLYAYYRIDDDLKFAYALSKAEVTFGPTPRVLSLPSGPGRVPSSAAPSLTDLDSDGRSDLLFSWSDSAGWHILTYLLDGTLSPSSTTPFAITGMGIGTGDSQNTIHYADLSLDQVVIDTDTGRVPVDSIGVLQKHVQLIRGVSLRGPRVVYPMDLNGDGNMDLLLTDQGEQGWRTWVLLGKGNGLFEEQPRPGSIDSVAYKYPANMAFGDLNGDGVIDLCSNSSSVAGWQVKVAYGDGLGTFSNREQGLIHLSEARFGYSITAPTKAMAPVHGLIQGYGEMCRKAIGEQLQVKTVPDSLVGNTLNYIAAVADRRWRGAMIPTSSAGSSTKEYFDDFTWNKEPKPVDPSERLFKRVEAVRLYPGYPVGSVDRSADPQVDGECRVIGVSVGGVKRYPDQMAVVFADYWQPIVADLNGDGICDLGLSYVHQPPSKVPGSPTTPMDGKWYTFTALAAGRSGGHIVRIDPNNSADVEIAYTTTTLEGAFDTTDLAVQYPAVPFNVPLMVVHSTCSSNGIGGRDMLTYGFANGVMDLWGRGILGFQHTWTKAAATGMNQDTWATLADSLLVKGSLPTERVEGRVDGVCISREQMTYREVVFGGSRSRYLAPEHTENWTFGLDGAVLTHVRTTTEHDRYGNLVYTLTNYDDGSSTLLSNTYAETSEGAIGKLFRDTWILGRLTGAELTNLPSEGKGNVRRSEFRYDQGTGQLTSEIALAHTEFQTVTTYDYDKYGNVLRTSISTSVDTAITLSVYEEAYDSRFLTQVTDPLGYVVRYVPDPLLGLNAETYDVDENITRLHIQDGAWDLLGRFKKISYPDGTVEEECSYVYSGTDVPHARSFNVKRSSLMDLPSITFHDALGRVVRTVGFSTNYERTVQEFHYDELGRTARRSLPYFAPLPPGQPVPFEQLAYDALGRCVRSVAADGDTTKWTFIERQVITTNPLGQRDTVTTDTRGRRTAYTDNAGNKVTYGYDADGNQNKIVDQAGRAFTIAYHELLGKPSAVQSANTKFPINYTYDARGNLVQVTSGGVARITTRYTHDLLGRTVSRIDEERKPIKGIQSPSNEIVDTVRYVYNPPSAPRGGRGKLHQVIVYGDDRLLNQTFNYDRLGRSKRTRYSLSNWTKVKNKRVTDAWSQIAPSGVLDLAYGYDLQGRLDSLIYPRFADTDQESDLTVTYAHQNGGVHAIRTGGRTIWQVNASDPWGTDREVAMNDGAMRVSYTHDRRNANLDKILTTFRGQTIQQWDYRYDAIGNVTYRQQSPEGRSTPEQFTYDALNRLQSMQIANLVPVSFAYDTIGNISHRSDRGYYGNWNDKERMLGQAVPDKLIIDALEADLMLNDEGGPRDMDDEEYYMDELGNRFKREHREKALFWIDYTSFNKPRSLSRPLSDGSSTAIRYTYDAGNRQQIEVATEHVRFVLGGDFEVTVKLQSESGQVVRQVFIAAPNGPVAMSQLVRRNGTRAVLTYLLRDAQGSITGTWSEGRLQVFAYDAWGLRVDPATRTALKGGGFIKGYTGHEEWDLVGLINMGGRIYDPLIAQFLQVDPVWDLSMPTTGLTAYGYCAQNPLRYTDPSGLIRIGNPFKAIGNAVGSIFSDPGRALLRGIIGAPLFGAGSLVLSNAPGVSSFIDKNAGTIVAIETTVVMMALGVPPVASGFATGFSSSFSQTYLNGGGFGDALESGLRSGIITGVSAGITAGIGSAFTGTDALSQIGRTASHAAFQGTLSEVQGGDFWQGALPALVSSGSTMLPLYGGGTDIGSRIQRTLTAAAVSGTSSALGGGKFVNGAATGAFVHLFNYEQHLPSSANRSPAGDLSGSLNAGPVSLSTDGSLSVEAKYAAGWAVGGSLESGPNGNRACGFLGIGYGNEVAGCFAGYKVCWPIAIGMEAQASFGSFGASYSPMIDANSMQQFSGFMEDGFRQWIGNTLPFPNQP